MFFFNSMKDKKTQNKQLALVAEGFLCATHGHVSEILAIAKCCGGERAGMELYQRDSNDKFWWKEMF